MERELENKKRERTMSSLVIARVTGKSHKNVLRDIRNMEDAWVKVNGRKFELVEYTDRKGEKRPCYELKFDECMYVAAKWNDETRAKLVKRWKELELQRIAEERNPDLSVNRAIEAYRKQGKSDAWIATRMTGIVTRNAYTKTLQEHDVKYFGTCTDAIYKGLFDMRARDMRKKRNLPQKANVREQMDMVQLSAVMLSEALASENIEKDNVRGDNGCVRVSLVSARNVAGAVSRGRKQLEELKQQ